MFDSQIVRAITNFLMSQSWTNGRAAVLESGVIIYLE